MKNFYEMEKERIEGKIQEERERAEKRAKYAAEELEMNLRNEVTAKEEEIEAMH